LRYKAGSCDSVGRYWRINGSGRETGCGDPTPPVSASLAHWGQGTDSQTSSSRERKPRAVGPHVQTGSGWWF